QLDGPAVQVVEALLADEAEEPASGRGAVRLRDLPAREVAAADVDHLPLRHQLLHRLPHLVPGRVTIDVVHLVQVDAIRAEPAQAVVAGAADVVRGETRVVRAGPHLAVHLGREHDLLAASPALPDPPADDLLGDALARLPPVDVGGVEEVDAELERTIHDDEAVALARERTEVHRAETEPAHLEAGAAETC